MTDEVQWLLIAGMLAGQGYQEYRAYHGRRADQALDAEMAARRVQRVAATCGEKPGRVALREALAAHQDCVTARGRR